MLFNETDVRVPDARRKKLAAKLAAGMGRGGGGGVAMPRAAGAVAGVGRMFHGASTPRANVTHGGSVLSSIMARLGVGARGGMDSEVSPGHGMAIDYRPPHPAPPIFGGGVPIPAAGGGGVGDPYVPPSGPPIPSPGPIGSAPQPNQAPAHDGDMIPFGSGNVGAPTPTAAGVLGGPPPNLVPLGNGMFYDVAADQVVDGGGGGGSAGSSARRLV